MQIKQPTRIQFQSYSTETTYEIQPKLKLAAVLHPETESTSKLSFLPVSAPILKPEPKFGRPLYQMCNGMYKLRSAEYC